jgi:leucyl-tRNA synthetase
MCIAPFAPHITDELWQQLGHSDSINKNHWPGVDENYLQEDEITIAFMVNGKLRAELKLNKDADKAEMEKAALPNPRIQEFLNGKEPKKVIVVPGKLVNVVI